MKKITLLLFLLVNLISYSQTHEGSLTLTSQAEIDSFNYTEIDGRLTIREEINGDIKNLNGLIVLNKVSSLTILENTSLINLEGLDNISNLRANITIKNNTKLRSLKGLNSNVVFPFFLFIENNPELNDLCGIVNTKATGSRYSVLGNKYNPTKEELINQCHNPVYEGDLILQSQSEIDNFEEISIIGNLTIEESIPNTITNLYGLENLTNVTGNIIIKNNSSLNNFCGLQSLLLNGTITGTFNTTNNAYNPSKSELENEDCTIYTGNLTLNNQTEIDNFAYTKIIGNLIIEEKVNQNIINIDNLSIIQEIEGSVTIKNNLILSNFCGIQNLISNNKITDTITIIDNAYNPTLTGIADNCSVKILYNDLTLTSQAEIDAFDYNIINRNLTISEDTPGSILNLNNLKKLITINGSLTINENSKLSSLKGLDNIIKINELKIYNNNSLATLEGFTNLEIIGGKYSSRSIISNNNSLTSINSFNKLSIINGDLTIGGYENNSPLLANLNGFNELTTIDGSLIIRENSLLTTLNAFNKLTSINSSLIIEQNPLLESLVGFNNLNNIGGTASYNKLDILFNNSLSSIEGLNNLSTIDAHLAIYGNLLLKNLNGLEKITSINGDIKIGHLNRSSQSEVEYGNPKLTSIEGLKNINKVNGHVYIRNNNMLTSLLGLDKLTFIGLNLEIRNNTVLKSLNSLYKLTSLEGELNISRNNNLIDFCAISQLIENKQIIPLEYSISENGYNPSFSEIQNICSVIAGDTGNGIYNGSITLKNQAEIDDFNYTNITGNLEIKEETPSNITNLSNLTSINSIGGSLFILENDKLTSLTGLKNLNKVYGLIVSENQKLESLNGLTNLKTSNSLIISKNGLLQSLHGLHNLATTNVISIYNNPKLITLQGLNNSSGNLENISISNNQKLNSLKGLDNIDSIDGFLTITNNNSLTSLKGLNKITSTGYLTIYNNNLTTLQGLNNLETITRDLRIGNRFGGYEGTPYLVSLEGLDKLSSIDGSLWIYNNNKLTSLSGLENLTTIRSLRIENNTLLTSLNGLDNVETYRSRSLHIINNQKLSNYCALQTLVLNNNNILFSTRENAVNPKAHEITNGTHCFENNTDTDNDGITNDKDLCQNTPQGTIVYADGCAIGDTDNDGILNHLDLCPNTPEGETVNEHGCGNSQLDDDFDGILNPLDECPDTPIFSFVNSKGCIVKLSNERILNTKNVSIAINNTSISINWEHFKIASIYNMTGSLLKTSNNSEFDISEIAAGVYVLVLKGKNNQLKRVKIVIQ